LVGNGNDPVITSANLTYESNILSAPKFAGSGSELTNLNGSYITDGTVNVTRGGTGANNFTSGRLLLGNGIDPITNSGNLTWSSGTNTLSATNIAGSGAGITALNVNSSNVSGTLGVANGGTGQTTFGMNRILFGSGGNGAISTMADLTFDGTTLTCYGDFATYKGLFWMNQLSRLSRVLATNQFTTGSAVGDIVLISDAKLHLVGGSTGTQAPAITINAANNVGIGNTAPAATDKLSITGNTKITGTATIDTNLIVGGTASIADNVSIGGTSKT